MTNTSFLPKLLNNKNNHQLLILSNESRNPFKSRSKPAFNHRLLIHMAVVVSDLEKLALGDVGEEKVVKPTTTEEFYVFIAALRRLRDDYEGIGIIPFNPDFIRKMFGPLLLDKRLRRSDGDIREAVDLWCSDRAAAEEKHGHISHWDVSRVTSMRAMFQYDYNFNEDISAWDTSNVTDMQRMFFVARAFNQPIGGWDVSKVENMRDMFCEATAFNQSIGGWDVSKVQDMQIMFYLARAFNQPIGRWDVSNVQNMQGMFANTTKFNQPIGGWDVCKVEDMRAMFCEAAAFNQPIGGWDVSKVQNMQHMFREAAAFNQPIGEWDVSKVQNMQYMFDRCPIEEVNKLR